MFLILLLMLFCLSSPFHYGLKRVTKADVPQQTQKLQPSQEGDWCSAVLLSQPESQATITSNDPEPPELKLCAKGNQDRSRLRPPWAGKPSGWLKTGPVFALK